MNSLYHRSLIVLTAFAPAVAAQTVQSIPAMTLPASQVLMGNVAAGPGPTTTAAINAAGTNGGACLVEIVAIPKPAIVGVFNTNSGCGGGLGLGGDPSAPTTQDPQPLYLTSAGAGRFNAVTFRLTLAQPSTEIGIGIGDWSGPAVLGFYLGDTLVTSFTTPAYSSSTCVHFMQLTGGTFDRVDVDVSSSGGNFVLTELWTEVCGAATQPFGAGCQGTLGAPMLSALSPPTPGNTFALSVANTTGLWAMAIGSSAYADPLLGVLPFDFGIIGAPGCPLLCSTDIGSFTIGGTGVAFGIPPGLSGSLCFQVVAVDASANNLGLTVSNGLRAFIR